MFRDDCSTPVRTFQYSRIKSLFTRKAKSAAKPEGIGKHPLSIEDTLVIITASGCHFFTQIIKFRNHVVKAKRVSSGRLSKCCNAALQVNELFDTKATRQLETAWMRLESTDHSVPASRVCYVSWKYLTTWTIMVTQSFQQC